MTTCPYAQTLFIKDWRRYFVVPQWACFHEEKIRRPGRNNSFVSYEILARVRNDGLVAVVGLGSIFPPWCRDPGQAARVCVCMLVSLVCTELTDLDSFLVPKDYQESCELQLFISYVHPRGSTLRFQPRSK